MNKILIYTYIYIVEIRTKKVIDHNILSFFIRKIKQQTTNAGV